LVRVRNLLLLREYHLISERLRARAEGEARSWRLVSGVAGALAGALDHQSVTDALRHLLHAEMGIELAAVLEGDERGLELVATTPPADDGEARPRSHVPWSELPSEAVQQRWDGAAFRPILGIDDTTELVAIPIVVG